MFGGFIKFIYIPTSLNYTVQLYVDKHDKAKNFKINGKNCKIIHDKSGTFYMKSEDWEDVRKNYQKA